MAVGRYFNKGNLTTSSNRFGFLNHGLNDGNLYVSNADEDFFLIHRGNALPSPKRTAEFKKQKTSGDSSYWTLGLWDTDRSYLDLNKVVKSIKISLGNSSYDQFFHDRVLSYHAGRIIRTTSVTLPDFWGFFTLNNEVYYRDGAGNSLHIANGKVNPFQFTGDLTHHPLWVGTKSPLKILWNSNAPKNVCIRLDRSLFVITKNVNGAIDTKLLLKDFDFEANAIVSILFDEETETIWMGSKNNGLFRFSKKQFRTLNVSDGRNSDEVYYAQTPFIKRSVLTSQGFVLGLDDRKIAIANQVLEPTSSKYTLMTDSAGYIWREQNGTLFKMDRQFKIIGQWKIHYELTNLLEGRGGWIYAAMRDHGLIRIRKTDTTGSSETVDQKIGKISYLAQISNDELLIGSANGLSRLNLITHKQTAVPGLENQYVRSIYCPKPYDKIWVTTYGDGFFLLEKGKLIQFPLDRDKYLSASHCIIEDEKAYFWITTNKGLFQVAKQDLLAYASRKTTDIYYAYFSRENGFQSNEFNGGCQPCAVHLEDSTISLPSMNGLIFFKPKNFSTETPDSELFIDKIEVNNISQAVSGKIDLKNDFALLTIHVATPYYGNKKNLQLQYSLESDPARLVWFPVRDDGVILVSNLRSGQHTLRIRKLDGFGINRYSSKTLQLKVLPAWFETWLFRIIMVALVCLGIFLYIRRRTKILLNRNKLLETRITDRTLSLQMTLETLQASQNDLLTQMLLYERLIGSISHDIRTPLIYLTRSGKNLSKLLEGKEMDTNIIDISKANWEFSERLLHLTNNLLDLIKSWLTKDRAETETLHLHEIVQEKLNIFNSIANEKETELSNEVNQDLTVKSHLLIISVIVYNLLDNATKATKNGKISVSNSTIDGRLHLIVKDNGIGMTPEIMKWVNEPERDIQLGSEKPKIPQSSGMGLTLVTQLSSIIHLKILAEKNEQSGTPPGTAVHIIFPED